MPFIKNFFYRFNDRGAHLETVDIGSSRTNFPARQEDERFKRNSVCEKKYFRAHRCGWFIQHHT